MKKQSGYLRFSRGTIRTVISGMIVLGLLVEQAIFAVNPCVVRTFEENGKLIDEIVVPGRPPLGRAEAAVVPPSDRAAGINVLSPMPAFTWCYGCSATSAGMMMGYYDNRGYDNMYTGTANGGLCPLNNEIYWGYSIYPSVTCGECPLVATHMGIDGRSTRGNVDDYWIDYGNPGPDPYIANSWIEHVHGDCTADYMGTSQSRYSSGDGNTWFYNYSDGSPLYDYTGCEPGNRDGCHGMKLFVVSRGYAVSANFSQYILGYNGNTLGFGYDDFKNEIDAGRPVMIQVEGHSMVGFGYNDTGRIIYIHDTWDNNDHSMIWGESYYGMQHYGVTVLRLENTFPEVTVAATDASAGEPGTGQGTGTFTFSRTGSTTMALTVNITVGGTATGGSDIAPLETTVDFAAGSATATMTVSVIDDTLAEGNETVVVTLAGGSDYIVGNPSSASIVIMDDEECSYVTGTVLGTLRNDFTGWVGMQIVVGANPITVTALGRMMASGNSGTHTIKLARANDGLDLPGGSVSLGMNGGTAGQFKYANLSSPVALAANTAYWILSWETANGDSWHDWNTKITATSAAVDNAVVWWDTLGGGEVYPVANQSFVPVSFKYGAGEILNVVSVQATDAVAGEPGSGQGTALFTFSRTGSTAAALTANFTVEGTATSGIDYSALGTTVSFAAGASTATKTVNVIDDSLVEGNETLVLSLASGTGYTIGSPSSATVTIQDDDQAQAIIRISPLTLTFDESTSAVTRTGAVGAAELSSSGLSGIVSSTENVPEDKLIDPETVLQAFVDNSRARMVVNLHNPAGVQEVNFNSSASLQSWHEAVKVSQESVLAALQQGTFSVRHQFENINAFSAEVTWEGLQALLNDSRVASIEPVHILEAHLNQGISLMNALASRSTFDGSGVAVAICDTGVDYNHSRLGGGGFPNSKVLGGYDFGDSDVDPIPNGAAHGTACAGIAAGDLGTVGDYIGGVAPGAKIYALKISYGSTGSAYSDAMIAAWDWCVSHKNDSPNNPILVISTSFGGSRFFENCDSASPAMTAAANNAVAAGITVLASSGNNGYCESMGWPACISSVISVGAVYDASFGHYYPCLSAESCAPKISGGCSSGYYADDTTAPDKVASYSNTALFLGLLAPANQCYTLDISGSAGYASGDYAAGFGGTSAACPYAAGAVATLQSAAKTSMGNYLAPAAVKSIFNSTGDSITDTKVAVTKPRINLGNAIATLPTGGVPFRIYNDGTGALTVSSITPESSAPWISVSLAGPFSIAPGGYQDVLVNVNFSLAPSGESTSRLIVISSDSDKSPYPGGVYVVARRASPSVAFVTSAVLGTLRNDYSGWVGMQIVVGANPITVTALGRIMASGNNGTHVVKLVRASDGLDVAGGSVSIGMSGGTAGQFKYANLSSPATLLPGTIYWVLSQETAGGDSWFDWNTQVTTTAVATDNAVAWGTGPGAWNVHAIANQSFVPVSFRYTDEGDGVVNRRAVIVGVSDYVGTVNDLSFCDDDALDFRAALLRDSRWNIANIQLLTDSQATRANVQAAIANMVSSSDLDDICVFYFSGHGTAGSDLTPLDEADGLDEYVCPHDFNNIRDDELSDWFSGIASRTVAIFFDTCFCGGQIKGLGRTVKSVNLTGRVPLSGDGFDEDLVRRLKDLDDLPNLVVSTACDDAEYSEEWTEYANGVYTEFLLQALAQEAADGNANGQLSVEEGHSFLYPFVVESVPDQHPQLHDGNGAAQAEFIATIDNDAELDFVTGTVLGTLRNNWNGYVGMQIVVGANPITVTALGRMMASGNSGTHTVKLVRATDGLDVAGGSVSLGMSGGTAGQFKYGSLSSPVVLQAGTTYWLLSQEASGGDTWYDWDTKVTTASVAADNGVAWGTGPGAWNVTMVANQCFVPVSFRYSTAVSTVVTVAATDGTAGEPGSGQGTGTFTFTRTGSTTAALTVNFTVGGTAASGSDYTSIGTTVAFAAGSSTAVVTVSVMDDALAEGNETVIVTLASGTGYTVGSPASATVNIQDDDGTDTAYIMGTVLGTLRNDYSGWVGMQIVVGANPITVTALGRMMASGNSGTHTVKLVRASDGLDLAGGSVSLGMSGGTAGQFKYGSLSSPVVLQAGTTYWVLSQEASGGDTWSDWDTKVTTTSVAVDNGVAWGTGPGAWNVHSVANQSFVPVSFMYSTIVPTIVNVTATDAVAGEPGSGQGTGTFTFTRTGSTTAALTVNFTVGGTAASGSDYTSIGTTVAFAAGSSTAVVTVSVMDDALAEGNETVVVTLANGTGYTIGSSISATVTIQDDEASAAINFVTGTVLGTLRNDWSGYAGMNIVVGANPITVSALGRMMVNGNNGTHTVKLVRASDGIDVEGGSVSLAMSGGTAGQFWYVNLNSPVVLAANTAYYLVSQETLGGDLWHNWDTQVTTTGIATDNAVVWGAGPGAWNLFATPNQSFVPVSFKYVSTP